MENLQDFERITEDELEFLNAKEKFKTDYPP